MRQRHPRLHFPFVLISDHQKGAKGLHLVIYTIWSFLANPAFPPLLVLSGSFQVGNDPWKLLNSQNR